MPLLLTMSLLFAGFTASETARLRAVPHPSDVATPVSVIWIAAHPDDEAIVAPLLGKCAARRG
ncbi:MAG TPA: hypothetical protein VLC46_05215 [Thermoanaerobaculia bacterium]|jgi:hypothetical protein|nr:hypothetical protein [Thermoanaerobaculia bacterium]